MNNPYVIYTPAWTHISSGVRALHLLCDALNKAGEKAYLWLSEGCTVNPFLDTPVAYKLSPLSKENYYLSDNSINASEISFFVNQGIEPIIIYPDIVCGNPIGNGKSVRYLLAPAGAHGGDSVFGEEDMVWGYTSSICKEKVLTVPTVDRSIFNLSGVSERSGTCFYSHKYDRIFGNELLDMTSQSTRLDGTPKQIADILRKSSVCYVYEVSEIILCAQLCGCPVVLVETPYCKILPRDWDFPIDGVGGNIGDNWVAKFHESYDKLEKKFPTQLVDFIKQTQGWIKQ